MFKKLPNILIIFFVSIFLVQFIGLLLFFTLPQISFAADGATFRPQVGFGEFQKGVARTPGGSTQMIGLYVRAIYKYAIGIIGILAAVVLMIGGVVWITAGGNASRVGEAKAYIGASLTGLTLALLSYLILATVNPALVNFQISGVERVAETPKQNQPVQNAALKTNGCCDGRCGSINNSQDCKNEGFNWLDNQTIYYSCDNQQKCSPITKLEAADGCCELNNSNQFSSLPIGCKPKASEVECAKECEGTQMKCSFDSAKICQQSGSRMACRLKSK